MKIVWVVNMPIGPLAERLNVTADSGAWLSAALDNVKTLPLDLYVVTTCGINEDITIKEENVTYVGLSLGAVANYHHNEKKLARWKKLFEEISPDIVQIWGTEYQHSLSAISAAPENCQKLVYVQGVMPSIYENYYGSIPFKTLVKNTSPVELLTGKSIFHARRNIKRSAENESKIIKKADAIITETEWSKTFYRLTEGCSRFYFDILPINKAFVNSQREPDNVVPHTVFTSASNYPLKGVHNLLKAIYLVKKEYPDVKLLIPGFKIQKDLNLKQKITNKCYRRYLGKLITELDLWENVEFTGMLTSEQMARQLEKANVFVCSSKIENHSATLREAMFVGTPCISTCVGGIPEYLTNGENGELYSFEDCTALAGKIVKIFADKDYAQKLSQNAWQSIRDYYKNNESDISKIYTAEQR